MKIKPEHYAHIETYFKLVDKKDVLAHIEYLKTDPRVKDLGKRLRWDIFYHCGLTRYACDTLYKYLNDDHIDTALKDIMKKQFNLYVLKG